MISRVCVYQEIYLSILYFFVYVDYLNIIGTTQEINEARNYLKTESKMKDLTKTKICALQIEHITSGLLFHQFAYIEKILENSV